LLQKKYGINEFSFKDSNFSMSKKWVREYADKVASRNIDISYFANYRPEVITDEYVQPLKESGCSLIFSGIESIDPKVKEILGKNTSMEQMLKADDSIKKYNIKRLYAFMFGSPGDTEETIRSYIDFAIETDPFIMLVAPTMAFPGTALYDYAVQHNLLKDPKWFYSFLTPDSEDPYQARMMMEHLPPETVDKYVRLAYMKFYLRPRKIIEYMKYYKFRRFTSAIALKFVSFVNKCHPFTSTYKKKTV